MNLYFVFFEIVMVGLLAICLYSAWRQGAAECAALVSGVLFGLALEWATIQQLHTYTYGSFPLMLGPVPLCIGIGWGVILYAGRQAADATSLPEWARPVLEGLLAVAIDLSMDAIAIRLGMWDWGRGPSFEYFGVPAGNFWAWFWVVGFFSAGLRLCRRVHPLVAPLGAVLIGLVGVLGTNAFFVYVIPLPLHPLAATVLLTAALWLVLLLRPRRQRPLPIVAAIVPLAFHLFFLTCGVVSGALFRPPFLLAASLVALAVSLWWHREAGSSRSAVT